MNKIVLQFDCPCIYIIVSLVLFGHINSLYGAVMYLVQVLLPDPSIKRVFVFLMNMSLCQNMTATVTRVLTQNEFLS